MAFASNVPSPTSNSHWFDSLSAKTFDDETAQLMIVEIELDNTGNLFCVTHVLLILISFVDSEELVKQYHHQQNVLQRLSHRLKVTADLLEVCRIAAEEVRAVTGFDRVMVYEFDKDWQGNVLVEITSEDILCVVTGPLLTFPVMLFYLFLSYMHRYSQIVCRIAISFWRYSSTSTNSLL